MTFLEHLEDLRRRLFLSFISLFVAVIPAYAFCKKIYEFLLQPVIPLLPKDTKPVFLTLTEPFTVYLKVSLLTALFAVSPFIFYQIWKFVAPGLYRKEKKYVIPFVVATSIFFAIGGAFGYLIAFPFAANFFISLGSDFMPVLSIKSLFGLEIKMLLGIGLVFEMPTLVFFLARMGIVTSRWMVKNLKYAILAIFIVAAVITPSPDFINQTVLAVPMLGLYAISILVAFLFGKDRQRRRAAAAAPAEPAG